MTFRLVNSSRDFFIDNPDSLLNLDADRDYLLSGSVLNLQND